MIETERLFLRLWRPEDAQAYFLINQDPKVIEFLFGPLTMQQVQDFMAEANRRQQHYGYTLWAAELKATGALLGFIGLNYTDWDGQLFTPAVEVGYRLGSQYWGHGYATEGAKAALDYGFNTCGLEEIVSFTVPANVRSLRVMEKIGLKRDFAGDFASPKVAEEHRLSRHILYRIRKGQGD